MNAFMEHGVLPVVADAGAPKDRRPLPARAQYLIGILVVVTGAVLAAELALPHRSPSSWWTFAILLVFVLAADRLELYAGRFYDMRVATMPMVAAALLLPAAQVAICGLVFAVHRLGAHLLLRQRVFNGCNHALSGTAAWAVVWLLGGVGRPTDGRLAAAGVAATAVYVFASWGLLIAILHLTRDLSFEDLRRKLPALLTAEIGLGALGVAVAGVWHAQPVLVPFAILPLVLVWTALKIGELRTEANVDSKTGLFNARHLRTALEAEVDRALRYQRPLTLLVADLDFLRKVNNAYGHLAGDEVIAGIGDVLREQLRSTDVAARFGGEEFVIVLPETPPSRGVQVAERIRRAVAERPFPCGSGLDEVYVTVSIGLASFPADATGAEELLSAADEAVYKAKERGRNCVAVVAEQPLALQV
jgi:diguanylate cyclase (GGDEF)-like protein